jgi:hypothetical protein
MRGLALIGLVASLNLASGQPLVEAWRLFYSSGTVPTEVSLKRALPGEDGGTYAITSLQSGQDTVMKISASGSVEWMAQLPETASKIAFDPSGNLQVLTATAIYHFTRSGQYLRRDSLPALPENFTGFVPFAIDSLGNRYIGRSTTVVCLSPTGALLWQRTFSNLTVQDLYVNPQGEVFVAAGAESSSTPRCYFPYLFKLDSSGAVVWSWSRSTGCSYRWSILGETTSGLLCASPGNIAYFFNPDGTLAYTTSSGNPGSSYWGFGAGDSVLLRDGSTAHMVRFVNSPANQYADSLGFNAPTGSFIRWQLGLSAYDRFSAPNIIWPSLVGNGVDSYWYAGANYVNRNASLSVYRFDRLGNILWQDQLALPAPASSLLTVAHPDNHSTVLCSTPPTLRVLRYDAAGTRLVDSELQINADQQDTVVVAPDGAGGVYALFSFHSGAHLRRYDASGALLWSQQAPRYASLFNRNGDAVLIYSTSSGVLLRRVRPDGTLLYERQYPQIQNFPEAQQDRTGNIYLYTYQNILACINASDQLAWAIALPSEAERFGVFDGGVYLALRASDGSRRLVRYSTTGSLLWELPLGTAYVRNLTVDAQGNVSVLQYLSSTLCRIASYTASGALRWQREVADNLVRLDSARANRLYAVGVRENRYFLQAYDAQGQLLWEQPMPLLETRHEMLVSTQVDSLNRAYVQATGSTAAGRLDQLHILCYSSEGQLLGQVVLEQPNTVRQFTHYTLLLDAPSRRLLSRGQFSRAEGGGTDAFVSVYRLITPDVDSNGCVDDADLLLVLFAFGQTGSGLPADVNADGIVDDADLLTVLFGFGEGC